jgi:hypothetical protein
VNDDELERSWRNFKVLTRHLPGGTEKNHENLNQDSLSPGPLIEPRTSWIQSRRVNHSNTTFGLGLWDELERFIIITTITFFINVVFLSSIFPYHVCIFSSLYHGQISAVLFPQKCLTLQMWHIMSLADTANTAISRKPQGHFSTLETSVPLSSTSSWLAVVNSLGGRPLDRGSSLSASCLGCPSLIERWQSSHCEDHETEDININSLKYHRK